VTPPAAGREPATTGLGPAAAALAHLRHLTPRDRYLLEILAQHLVLTAEQIARLCFEDPNTARKRLVLLTRRGILDRFRASVYPGSQAWRYTLGHVGASMLVARTDRPLPRPGAHAERILRLAQSPRLDHLLGVNDFFVSLIHQARTQPAHGYALVGWHNERWATAHCAGLARPDAMGTWAQRDPGTAPPHPAPAPLRAPSGPTGPSAQPAGPLARPITSAPASPGTRPRPRTSREITFFLEHDTGTEPLSRLLDKLPGYAEAARGDGPDHPVLFWLGSRRREAILQDRLSRTRTTLKIATATRQYADETGTGPAGALWWIPGQHQRLQLIDLPTAYARTSTTGTAIRPSAGPSSGPDPAAGRVA